MKRSIGDTAVDPQTGWTWVCLGDHPNHGPHWSCYTARGEQYSSREPDRAEVRAHGSLERALAAGVASPRQKALDYVKDQLGRPRSDAVRSALFRVKDILEGA